MFQSTRNNNYQTGLHIQSLGLNQSVESLNNHNAYYPHNNISVIKSFLQGKARSLIKSENAIKYKRNIDIHRHNMSYSEYK